jgi:hemolysin activation/secretion protein
LPHVKTLISNAQFQAVRRNAARRLALKHKTVARVAIHVFAIVLATITSQPGISQQAARQPQLDLRRTERTFEEFQREQKRAKSTAVPLPQVAKPSGSTDTRPLFKLTGVVVEGAALFSGDAVAATYQPYLGKAVSQADLAAIAGKISELYRNAGYHLSRAIVPPQDIKGGRIRIKVIEGEIVEIVLKGDRTAPFGIRALLEPVADEMPSRRQTLERQLLLVNDLPGVRIADTGMEEIGIGSGRFRLIVYLETWRNYTALGLDNRGTPAVGPLEAYYTSSLNSSLVVGDALGINLSTVPDTPQELGFGRLFYNAPIGIDGARIGASASYSEIRPGDERRALDTRSQAQTYELRGSINPMRSREASLCLTAAADVGDFSDADIQGLNYRDHLRAISLTSDYQMHDDFGGWNYLTLTVRQGLDVLGATKQGDLLSSRSDGSGTFSKLEFFFTRYQKLSDIWSLKMSASGQLASTAQLASQEFYLGAPFGRGYWGAEVGGDNGVAGSLELRFDQVLKHDLLKGYQLYGFVDRTVAWTLYTGDVLSLSLAGGGARLYLADDLQAGIEATVPLEYHIPASAPRDPRVFFYLSKIFKLCPGSVQMRCS